MDIVKEVELFTLQFFEKNIPPSLAYHSIEHTKRVVKIASEISHAEGLNDENKKIVLVAAWFHDIGYAKSLKNHEEESCIIARRFLSGKNSNEDFIADVEKCIRATKIGVEPQTKNEMILSDADFAHTGMENFIEISKLYRKEVCNCSFKKPSKLEYWKSTLKFLKDIKFLTSYAHKHLESIKNQNIKQLQEHINRHNFPKG